MFLISSPYLLIDLPDLHTASYTLWSPFSFGDLNSSCMKLSRRGTLISFETASLANRILIVPVSESELSGFDLE